jgi:hypothetical protein
MQGTRTDYILVYSRPCCKELIHLQQKKKKIDPTTRKTKPVWQKKEKYLREWSAGVGSSFQRRLLNSARSCAVVVE